jgi:hypothetical protein
VRCAARLLGSSVANVDCRWLTLSLVGLVVSGMGLLGAWLDREDHPGS